MDVRRVGWVYSKLVMSRANGVENAFEWGTTKFEFLLLDIAQGEAHLFKIYAGLAIPFEAAPYLANENFPYLRFVGLSTFVSLDLQFEQLLRERNEVSSEVFQRRVGDVVCKQGEKEGAAWSRGGLPRRPVCCS